MRHRATRCAKSRRSRLAREVAVMATSPTLSSPMARRSRCQSSRTLASVPVTPRAAVPAVVRTRWTGPPGVVGGRTLLEWPGCDHGGGRAELSPVEVSTWQASSVFRRSTRTFRVRRENLSGGDDRDGDEAVRSGATFLWAVETVKDATE